jgi:hypothetical protein
MFKRNGAAGFVDGVDSSPEKAARIKSKLNSESFRSRESWMVTPFKARSLIVRLLSSIFERCILHQVPAQIINFLFCWSSSKRPLALYALAILL